MQRNPFNHGNLTGDALREAGFKSLGNNVRIESTCTILGLENIEIGDNVRIDGYCTIVAVRGQISIGSFVHIAGYCALYGGNGIVVEDFAGLSAGVRLYSTSDDYSGEHLTNPTVPARYTGVVGGAVTLRRHAIIGAGSVLLPGVTVGEGSAVGSQALVSKSLDPWGIYAGCPARRIKARSRRLLELEKKLREDLEGEQLGAFQD